ncbi:hypothetical protein F4809DRAFT_654490 [Biscogniauxia mediterranea]|nr:hypothetical protein F4809DRAFT_654490 [Biscogniauxia mediterranea]
MYIFFLFGVLCAIAHHIFYSFLDGRPADNQMIMLRYGTVLAFAAKAGLVAAIGVAFKQRIWTTVRSKLLSVAALDSLFAATEDVTVFLNFEILRRAKMAILLAAFVWATPLVIILTSNTLSVAPALKVTETTCPGIRTLNFEKEEVEEWRTPTKIDHLYGLSVSVWNTTELDTTSPDWFDYYTAASDNFIQIATHAAYIKQPVSKINADVDICGAGWNCTYVVNFTAPAYKCTEVASGVGSEITPLGDHKPPNGFSTDLLLPTGIYSYYAFTGGGEYSNMQMNESYPGGMPKISPPYPQDLGAFRTEPIMWIGYTQLANPDETPPSNKSMPGWEDAFIPKVIACENWEAHYTVRFNLTGGQQITNITERTLLHPVMNTTWEQDIMANDGTNDNTTASPKSGYVYPRDVRRYRRVAAFHSLASQVRYFVNGTLDSHQVDVPIQATKALQTKLLNPRGEYFPYPNLIRLVEEFYEDMVLSLFANYQFLPVVWAAKPDVISGVDAGDDSTRYPCERSRIENRFDYHARDLWMVYAIAIVLSAIGVVSGTMAVLENEGVLLDTRFSSIVAATRGPALERLGWGAAATADGTVPQDIKNLKVGYGVVHRNSGLGAMQDGARAADAGDIHYGFGLEGDVRQMRSRC